MAEKSPAFQWYPKDYLADGKCTRLTDEEAGIYSRMMSLYWVEGRSLPSDLTTLAEMLPKTKPERLKKAWARLRHCWIDKGDGTLAHKRLDEEWAKQQDRREKAAQSAGKRWQRPRENDANALRTHYESTANALQAQHENAVPSECTSSASATASSSALLEQARALSDYLFRRAVDNDLLGGHFDPSVYFHNHRDVAQKLVSTHGLDLCRDKADRLIAAIVAQKIRRRNVSLGLLAEVWAWREMGEAAGPEDAYYADLRARTGGGV